MGAMLPHRALPRQAPFAKRPDSCYTWSSMERKPVMKKFAFWVVAALCLAGLSRTGRSAFPWRTDLPEAANAAYQNQKLLLLYFSGSDWCGWCQRLDAEVFSTDAFKAYADAHLVPVLLDFPSQKQLAPDMQARNERLARYFQISGFPSLLLFSPDGELLARLGYQPGGPDAYVPIFQQALARYQLRNPNRPL